VIRLVFIHGWGFDAGFWAPLRARLGQHAQSALDLGFFGPAETALAEGDTLVAVTHSYGTTWLLRQRPFAWDRLVAINGFPRFTEGTDFAPATPRRPVERMLRRFREDPAGVLDDFRRRCGETAPAPASLDADRLGAALEDLLDGDGRPGLLAHPRPVLALHGRADPIVPPAMAEHAFAGADTTIAWHETAGHLLPLSDPDWCAAQIDSFIETRPT
jgi:pimeloyl-[acyl-carrier protein] methyl ester esterase